MPVQFTITSQQHEWLFDTQGNRYGQWTVSFQTPSGVISQVIIPDDSYDAKTIAPMIAAEVEAIEEVQALQHGEPAPTRPPAHGQHHHHPQGHAHG